MTTKLIPVQKDGITLKIHPDALDEHRKLGWVLVEQPAPRAEAPKRRAKRKPAAKSEK